MSASSDTSTAEGTFNWKIKYNYPPQINSIADQTNTAYDASGRALIMVTDLEEDDIFVSVLNLPSFLVHIGN